MFSFFENKKKICGNLAAILLANVLSACDIGPDSKTQTGADARHAQYNAVASVPTANEWLKKKADEEKKLCSENFLSIKKDYRELMSLARFWDAANTLRGCVAALDDPELKVLFADAEIKSHLQDIKNPSLSSGDKAKAIQSLLRDYPEKGRAFESLLPKLLAQAEQRKSSEHMSQAKREGVAIGMTKAEALASVWGRPKKINRTTTARGEAEQWVYGDNNYLYFDDGILTAIQN